MSNQDCMAVARDVVARVAVAGALAAGAAVASSTSAAADPPPAPPTDPAVPAPAPVPEGPPMPVLGSPLGADGFSLPALPADSSDYLLGQNPLPSAPGGPPGTPPPNLGFNNAYFLPQHEVPSAPGEGTMFDVPPGEENANLSGIDYARRVWHLYQGGYLKGSLLGQIPQDQLGEPLPGTAPPPGTNIPPGLTPPESPQPPPPSEAIPPAPLPLP